MVSCFSHYSITTVPVLLLSSFLISARVIASENTITLTTQVININGHSYSVQIPDGYFLQFLSAKLQSPRIISFGTKAEMFIGSASGKVYRLQPPYSKVDVLLSLPHYPHSIVVRGRYIYIAQTNGVYRAPYQAGQAKINLHTLKLYVKLPAGAGHNSRTLRLSPDNKLYVSLGISGNCSDQYLDESYPEYARRGGVLLLNEKAGNVKWESYASGLRNPVGFDWQPQTGVMYASNNGPDHWGFQQPKEYFSQLKKASFHGMPWYQYVNNKLVRDNCISSKPPKAKIHVKKPVIMFAARNAPMAVNFISHGSLAIQHSGDAIVALHGSWAVPDFGTDAKKLSARREPKLVIVHFKNGIAQSVSDLIRGFQLKNGRRWARPIGVAIAADGALYFTSDGGNHGLFRLTHKPIQNPIK